MNILFLHGWNSTPGGLKPTFLKNHGHTVSNPHLPDDDFDAAVRIAQAEYDHHHPDVVVGSSRGGAVAMNINSGTTPLVLLCPAWNRWGRATTVKPNTVILHSRADDVVPFADSEELVSNSGLPAAALIEVGADHRLADATPLRTMLEACSGSRPRVVGCDFGVPKRAGDQAKKIILIEAIRVGDHDYAIEPHGRNTRLVRDYANGGSWKEKRRGWTLPDLASTLTADRSVSVAAFDFPFSIPTTLLQDAEFAGLVNRPVFGTRREWAEFVSNNLRLQFSGDGPNAELEDLARFDVWRNKRFWKKRTTDMATQGSPPLKHKFQNVFAMTLAGTALLHRLDASGYLVVLDTFQVMPDRCVFETYPREVASRVGFAGSYKRCPGDCLAKAEEYLHRHGITLDFDEGVRRLCQEYRTSGNDPDGADAFLCLVAAIAFAEGMAELCDAGATAAILKEEAAMVVPKRSRSAV